MILYRYLTCEGAEKTLSTQLFKTSKFSEFNDPFELAYRITGIGAEEEKKWRMERIENEEFYKTAEELGKRLGLSTDEVINRLREGIENEELASVADWDEANSEFVNGRFETADRLYRVVCFSAEIERSRDEILMWSHYSEGHEGIRIGFDLPFDKMSSLYAVDYLNARIPINRFAPETPEAQEAFKHSLIVKSCCWEYEKEYRFLVPPDECSTLSLAPGKEAEFIGFKVEHVKYVDFGIRCPRAVISKISEIAREKYPSAEIRRARMHASDYALSYTCI